MFIPSAAAVAIAADESMLGVYKENLRKKHFSDILICILCNQAQIPKFLGTVEDDPLSVLLELLLLQQPVGGAVLLQEGPVLLLQLPQQVLQEVVGGHSREVPLQF